jgi:hypothetical protein
MLAVTHGVVSRRDRTLISHALFADESAFCTHLHERPSRFVPVEEAMRGCGDALTVDDATHAGFRAVVLALEAGHSVSWCINGSEIEDDRPYFPFQISSMLDRTSRRSCSFERSEWDLSTVEKRRTFRYFLKQRYLQLNSHASVEALIELLSEELRIEPELPKEIRTVGADEVAVASSFGCRLLNHGWTHLNPNALSSRQLQSDIARNAKWIQSFQVGDSDIYVPPYGRPVPHARAMELKMLLADRTLSCKEDGVTFHRRELECTSSIENAQVEAGFEVAA